MTGRFQSARSFSENRPSVEAVPPRFGPRDVLRDAAAASMLLLALLVTAPGAELADRCPPCGSLGASELRAQDLDERAEVALARTPATGAVVAVVHGDSLILLQTFGHADDERAGEMPLGSLFPLGDAGEILLGALAVRSALDGIVRLESPVSSYDPELPAGISEATLAQLFTHTAGLDDSPLLARLPGEEPEALPPERELETLSDRILLTTPGTVRSRSRFSILVAGHVLESAAGRPLPELMREQVAEPAGMVSTVFSSDAAASLGTVPGYVRGQNPDRPFDPVPHPGDSLLAPHLRVWASAPDLARLLGTWLGALPLQDSSSSLSQALQLSSLPLVSDPENPAGAEVFGLGWQLHEFEGRPELRRSGGGPGHSVLLRVLPDVKLGVVVLTNGSESLFQLSSFILERLTPVFAAEAVEPISAGAETNLFPSAVVGALEPVQELGPEHAGTYRNGSEILVLVETEDGLRADMGTAQPLEIRALEDGVHTVHIEDGRQTMRIRIVRDLEGEVYLLLGGRAFLLEEG